MSQQRTSVARASASAKLASLHQKMATASEDEVLASFIGERTGEAHPTVNTSISGRAKVIGECTSVKGRLILRSASTRTA